jgi:O-methyltransferase involved in polyketide biosynthesis
VPDRDGIQGDVADPPAINTTVAHNARVWDYWLGGKDNFAVDRQVGDRISETFPVISDVARASRQFLIRSVRHLAGEAGIRQFLDIGTGLPTANNTHEVAQAVAPRSRVVYVDNDPLVLVHARALLTSSPEGVTDYVDADVQEPDAVVAGAARTLDLTAPVAVMMLGVLNFVLDDADARHIVTRVMAAVPSGSYLALSHPTLQLGGEMNGPAMAFWNERATPKIRARSRAEVTTLLTGLELVDPGLVSCPRWRPDDDTEAAEMPLWGAVARKP